MAEENTKKEKAKTKETIPSKERRLCLDAGGAVLGRLCSHAAKQALLGNTINIINCEKVLITGSRDNIIEKYIIRRQRGQGTQKGPNFPSMPEQIVKRTIRNMLSYRQGRGERAFDKIKCYVGSPQEFEKEKKMKIAKQVPVKYLSLNELSILLRGGKI